MSRAGTRRVLLSVTSAYADKVLILAPANLIGYWRLNETAGVVAYDSSSQGNHGAYTGVDLANALGPSNTANVPYFDGANDYVNIYSAAFNADFNGQEGTFAIWAKVSGIGIWTDDLYHEILRLRVDGDNYIIIREEASNYRQIGYIYKAGTVALSVAHFPISTVGWFHVALTWSKTADGVIAYINGVQTGTTQTGLGAWAGALAATMATIGSAYTTPLEVWSGWLAHAAIWNTALTPTQIAQLATV